MSRSELAVEHVEEEVVAKPRRPIRTFPLSPDLHEPYAPVQRRGSQVVLVAFQLDSMEPKSVEREP